jgi:hypothetical protein
MERGNAFVPHDLLGPDLLISRLYTDPQVQRFVAACFELDEVHELADPLAGLCLNVLTPGREHPWHFDTNEFAVSLLTQAPEAGGRFEYCPDIRSAQSECFDDVAGVLAGRLPDLVRQVEVRPGALQLFRGRYALHRVTAVEGTVPRHSAIFAYSRRPGVIGSVERIRQLFGRVLPEHLAAEGVRGPDRRAAGLAWNGVSRPPPPRPAARRARRGPCAAAGRRPRGARSRLSAC